MKPFYLVILLFFVVCCSKKQSDSPEADSGPRKPAEFALGLDSAKIYTANYRKLVREVLKDTIPVEAFTVRATDLLESLGVTKATPNFEYVRVYLGIDNNNKFRLMLTPVVGADFGKSVAGKDSILSGPYTRWDRSGLTALPTENGDYVLDFNMPCPNTCDTGSPLDSQ